MTKSQYLATLAKLYRAANTADTENKQDWMHADMAGKAGCAGFDAIIQAMVSCGVVSHDEVRELYNSL